MTMRRIETDAERITTEPAFLAVDDVRRALNIVRLKRLLAAQALNDPEVAYCQVSRLYTASRMQGDLNSK